MNSTRLIQVLGYQIECTLATVDSLKMLSKPKKAEIKRHVSIAQAGILDALSTADNPSDAAHIRLHLAVAPGGRMNSRLQEVIDDHNCDVAAWVEASVEAECDAFIKDMCG